MFMSISFGTVHLRLVTTLMERLRNGFYGVFPFRRTLCCILLLLLCDHVPGSGMGASAASVAAAATGCGAPEECSSEQLFDDCNRRGTTESAQCYCNNGVPRACRDVCDNSVTPDACPSQCQGVLLCKTFSDPASVMGSQFGLPAFAAIALAVAALAAIVTGLVVVYRRRKNLNIPCYAPSRPTEEPEGDKSHPALGSVQEEAVHSSQETCPPGDQSSTEPEVASLLSNA